MNKTIENSALHVSSGTDIPADLQEIVQKIEAIRNEDQQLPAERRLSELIGVKRHQLRRALAVMRDQGALPQTQRRTRRGGTTGNISDLVHNTNPVEVVELRLMMEPTLARLAALRATPAKIEEMRQAVRHIAKEGNSLDLHRMIAEASGNALAAEVYALVRCVDADSKLNMPRNFLDQIDTDRDTTEHEEIVEAIAKRAPDLAEKAMRKHLMAYHRFLQTGSS